LARWPRHELRQAGADLYVVVHHDVAVRVQKGFDLMGASG
jgi:hypothetical protein